MIRFFTEKAAKNVLENDDAVSAVTGEEDDNKENGVSKETFWELPFFLQTSSLRKIASLLSTLMLIRRNMCLRAFLADLCIFYVA